MNALGGTRGERNAKPKFAALDINKLYSTSRGESLEPSTQKSAAPRKHGMQSLGKVPSARRPPANLPSLKAEISSPSDQQGTWANESGDNQNNNSNNTSSITAAPAAAASAASGSTNNNAVVGHQHTSSHAHNLPGPHSSASSSSQWSSNEFPSLDGTGQYGPSGKQQHHHHHHQQHLHDGTDGGPQYMDGPQVSLRPQTDAASWMQQQQQGAGGGANNAGGMNGPNSNQQGPGLQQQQQPAPLPPQFRALMPPFMYRGNGGAGGNSSSPPPPPSGAEDGHSSRGGSGGGGGGGGPRNNNINSNNNNSGGGGGYNSMLPSFVLPSANHHQSSHGSNYSPTTQSGGRYRDQYGGGGGNRGPRGQMQPPRLANRQQQQQQQQQQQHQHDDHRNAQQQGSQQYMEPDILVQRPIIRDEELQRIEAISKDEGWAKDDEIDYNQKLQFSDDESEPSPPKETAPPVLAVNKQEKAPQQQQQQQQQQQSHHQEDDKRMAWSREVEREERLEQERQERERAEREQQQQQQQSIRPTQQQNGHVGGGGGGGGRGLDAEAKERLKLRREEDQRREMERKQAAAKKLQELEQKLSRKKTEETAVAAPASAATPATKDEDDREQPAASGETNDGRDRNNSSTRGGGGDQKEFRDRDRYEYGNARHDRYDRDRDRVDNNRDRDAGGSSWDMPPFSKNFQSNLPPRFQKRKLERNPSGNSLQGSGGGGRDYGGGGGGSGGREPSRNSNTANQGPTGGSSQSQQQGSDGKSVPFAQQYDPRFIHTQQSYGNKGQPQRRGMDDAPGPRGSRGERDRDDRDMGRGGDRDREREMIPREIMKRRVDSEEDDRFSSSGRESSSKLSGGRATPQLIRSVSDTSQRKTSVSSDDNTRQQVDPQQHYSNSKEIIGSWESEAEKEDRRLAEAAAALAKENQMQQFHIQQHIDSRRISESSAVSEGEPKQILQRIKESSPALIEEPRKSDGSKSEEAKQHNDSRLLSKAWEDSVEAADEAHGKAAHDLSLGSVDEKKDVSGTDSSKHNDSRLSESDGKMNTSQGSGKESDDSKYGSKKSAHSRGIAGGRHESSARGGGHSGRGGGFGSSGGYNRGGGSSWSRRGGGAGGSRMGHGRNYNQDYWSESDLSDDGDEDMRKDGKYDRKEGGQYRHGGSSGGGGQGQNIKEGFAPRGEPSRRGRGAMSSVSGGPGFRKPTVGKKIDGYGPPSSKSPFGGNDEKTDSKNQAPSKDGKTGADQAGNADDRTKQKQAALSAGLTNKPGGGSKALGGSLPQRSPSGNMKPPGKPAEETLSDQEKLKAAEKLMLESKKPRNDSSKSESHDEKVKEKPKTDSESHDTDDMALKSGSLRSNKQPQQGMKGSQQQTPGVPPGKSSAPAKPAISANTGPGSSSQNQKQPLTSGGTAAAVTQPKPGQDIRSRPSAASSNPIPARLVKPKRDGPDGGPLSETVDVDPNTTVGSFQPSQQQQQQLQATQPDKGNSLSINTSKTDNSKQHLDGATPPVNTIIFENTNYKSSAAAVVVPGQQQQLHLQQQPQQQQQQQPGAPAVQIKRQHSGGPTVPQQLVQLAKDPHQQQRHVPTQEEVFKAAPGSMQEMIDSQRPQPTNGPSQQQQAPQQPSSQPASQADVITSALQGMTFQKPVDGVGAADYDKDMKQFSFEADLSQMIEAKNKATAAGLILPKTATTATVAQNMISPSTAELNLKIASVKKVWEMPTVPEHTGSAATVEDPTVAAAVHLASNFVTSQHQPHHQLHQFQQHSHGNLSHGHPAAHTLAAAASQSYAAAGFGQDQPSMEQHFNKSGNESVVMGGAAGVVGTESDNSYGGQQHAAVAGANVQHPGNMSMKHAAEVLAANNANVCKVKPTQQNMHQSTGLGLSPPPQMQQQQQGTMPSAPQTYYQPSQYGMSAIPSPPAVIYNSSAMPSQGGLYNAFQLEPGRSQFSQFPGPYGTTGTTPYNAYMTTPPNIQPAPHTQDMYQSLTSQFRMSGAVQNPYNPAPSQQQQQLNNPSTMLISSSTNSLMSSSVKPSSQQIGAIGSKSGSVGTPYGQQYMGMFPPAPPPLQNNSFYSNSAGGQSAAAFFSSAGATQNYGLQAAAAGMFGGHGAQTPSNAPPPPQQQLPNFAGASQFLSSPLLAANAAAAISQQYRGGPNTNPQQSAAAAYMKSAQPQSHMQDPNGRQLKSPLNTDGLNNLKQIPPQASPPHHKGYAAATWELQNQLLQQHQQQQQQQQSQQPNPQQQLQSQQPNPQQHPQQQQMGQPPQSQQQNANRNMMASNQQGSGGLGGAAGSGGRPPPQAVQGGGVPQRYPAPIQRPTNNYSQPPVQGMHQPRGPARQSSHQQQPGQQQPGGGGQQPNMAQAMGNPNKHYYGGNRGGHVSDHQNHGGQTGAGNDDKVLLDGEASKDGSKKK